MILGLCTTVQGTTVSESSQVAECQAAPKGEGWRTFRDHEVGVVLIAPGSYVQQIFNSRSEGLKARTSLWRDDKPAWRIEITNGPADSINTYRTRNEVATTCSLQVGGRTIQVILARMPKTLIKGEKDSTSAIRAKVVSPDGRSALLFLGTSRDRAGQIEQLAVLSSLEFLSRP